MADDMSSGRMMPWTDTSRISELTRSSCLPEITRLPFGNFCTMVAARLTVTDSDRPMEPLPFMPLVLPRFHRLLELAPAKTLDRPLSRPSKPKLGLAVSDEAVLVWVWFFRVPLSLMLTATVRMSPTSVARASLKKPRAPGRHRELAPAVGGCGAGMGMLTGW